MAAQKAFQRGNYNLVVQAQGDNIRVQVGVPRLTLIPVAARIRTRPQREIDILNPAFQAVPVVGRDGDLRFLHGWLVTGPKIAITAMVGPGGSGKTRLAFEFLQHLPKDWQGGLLDDSGAAAFYGHEDFSHWSWEKPTLVVVDYAAMRAQSLARWFRKLADQPEIEHPLRILLLERHADPKAGWYQDLADGTWQGQRVRELFVPAEPRRVTPLDEAAQRRAVLQAGLHQAAAFAPPGRAVPLLPNPGQDKWFDQRLEAGQWADPLLLLMAAVIATAEGLNFPMKLTRPGLATELAKREKSRLHRSAQPRAAGDLLAHLYACITLCGGLARGQAVKVAEQEFNAGHKQYPGGAGQAVDDLAKYLGAESRLTPLLPDLLGEAYLPVVLGARGASASVRLSHVSQAGVASSLIRSAQDFGYAGEAWPLEWLKSLVAEGQSDVAILMAIENALPDQTLVLRRLAVEVTELLVERLAELPESVARDVRPSLARLLNNLSVRQSAMGQRAEALASIGEAVRHYRALTEADPDAFLPDLAMSLNNQANRQSEMGQRAEALASIGEAVRHYRALAEANPDAFLPNLAGSLNNQAGRQSEMGQRAEALASIGEAVRHYRALAEANPGAFLPNLAMSLNNQASFQSEMGQRAEALASIGEAVRHSRALAQANPDAFLPNLATSLNNQANQQSAMGQRAEALASIGESVRIRRALAEANPDAFLPNLAASLDNLSNVRSAIGDHAGALACSVEAVGIYRGLARANLDAFLSDLARSLSNQTCEQSEMGQREEALASIGEAVRHYRALAEANPGAFLPNLAASLNNQANLQSEMGQRAEALASIGEAVRIRRALAEANPDAFLPNLATSLSVLGNCLEGVEKIEEARDAAAECLRILAPSFAKHPGVFDGLARATCRDYLLRSQKLEMEPDFEILVPYIRLFEKGESHD